MIAVVGLAGCSKPEEAPPKPVVAVKVARAERATVRTSVSAPAVIWPREQASIAARITAPIRELRARKGDNVAASQVLAVLENRDVLAQREEASASLDDAEANLQKTSAGTLPADIERARGQLETAEAALNLAQKVYDRRSELFRQGAIPGRDLLQSQTELAQAKTNVAVAAKSLDLLRRQSGEKDVAIARSRVEQAKARLAQSAAQLQFTELRSPFAGTITDQLQFPGDMASPSTPTFTVMDLSLVNARAQVPEAQVARISVGQACEFHPADGGAPAAGQITVVNRAVDPARRTVEVWCQIPNAGGRLRANAFGDVHIFTGTASGVSVPEAAVQFNEGTRSGTVLVMDTKHIAHKKEVEAAEVRDGKVLLANGVGAGDTVIVEGGYGLPDGTAVKPGEK